MSEIPHIIKTVIITKCYKS